MKFYINTLLIFLLFVSFNSSISHSDDVLNNTNLNESSENIIKQDLEKSNFSGSATLNKKAVFSKLKVILLILSVIGLVGYFFKKSSKTPIKKENDQLIKIIEEKTITQDMNLLLINVKGQDILLSKSNSSLQYLTNINTKNEIYKKSNIARSISKDLELKNYKNSSKRKHATS